MERFSFASDVAFVPRGDLLDGGPASRPRHSRLREGVGWGRLDTYSMSREVIRIRHG